MVYQRSPLAYQRSPLDYQRSPLVSLDREAEGIDTTRICRVPRAVDTRSGTSGGKRLCISRGVLSSLVFQSSFMPETLRGVNTFSS